MQFNLCAVIYILLRKIKLLINLYVVSVCRSYLKFISRLDYFALNHVQENSFFSISLNCSVEVVYYLKQVFHLLCHKSVIPAEELPYYYLIL